MLSYSQIYGKVGCTIVCVYIFMCVCVCVCVFYSDTPFPSLLPGQRGAYRHITCIIMVDAALLKTPYPFHLHTHTHTHTHTPTDPLVSRADGKLYTHTHMHCVDGPPLKALKDCSRAAPIGGITPYLIRIGFTRTNTPTGMNEWPTDPAGLGPVQSTGGCSY